MQMYWDPDEWEVEIGWGGQGQASWGTCGQRRRSPEEIARIKTEKRRAHEDAFLAEAEAIKARRAAA